VLAHLVDRPVVARHSDNRAVEQAAALQPVQRLERHHPGQVAGDAEDHEHVGWLHVCRSAAVCGGPRTGSNRGAHEAGLSVGDD
jgi:hypothetical protein